MSERPNLLKKCWLLWVSFICKCIFASEIQATSLQIEFLSFYYYIFMNIGHFSLQSLSVLTSSLNCSQLTFSLFWIHFIFKLFYLKLINSWSMDTFVKKGCFRRCFLNLLSKIVLFEEISLRHLLRFRIFYFEFPVLLF